MFRLRKAGANRLKELVSTLEDLKITVSSELEAKCIELDKDALAPYQNDYLKKPIIKKVAKYIKQIDAVISMMTHIIDSKGNTHVGFLYEITSRAKHFVEPSFIMNDGDGSWSVAINFDKRLAEKTRALLNDLLGNCSDYFVGDGSLKIPVLMKIGVDVKKIIQTAIRQTDANIAFFDCYNNAAAKAVAFKKATNELRDYTEEKKKEKKRYDDAFIADLLDRFENCLKIGRTLPSHSLERFKTLDGRKFHFSNVIDLHFLFALEFFLLHAEHPLAPARRQQFIDIVKVNDANINKLKANLETFCNTADALLDQGHSENNTRIIRAISDEVKRQLTLFVTPEMIKKYYGEEYRALHRMYLLSNDLLVVEADYIKYCDLSDEKFAPLFRDYRRKFLGQSDKEMDSLCKAELQAHRFTSFFHRSTGGDIGSDFCKPPMQVVVDLLKFVDLQNQQRLMLSKKGAFSLGKTGELIMDLWDILLNALSTLTIEDDLITSVQLARTMNVTPYASGERHTQHFPFQTN